MVTSELRDKTDKVFDQFQEKFAPKKEDVGDFYNSMDPEGYLQWKQEINCEHP